MFAVDLFADLYIFDKTQTRCVCSIIRMIIGLTVA